MDIIKKKKSLCQKQSDRPLTALHGIQNIFIHNNVSTTGNKKRTTKKVEGIKCNKILKIQQIFLLNSSYDLKRKEKKILSSKNNIFKPLELLHITKIKKFSSQKFLSYSEKIKNNSFYKQKESKNSIKKIYQVSEMQKSNKNNNQCTKENNQINENNNRNTKIINKNNLIYLLSKEDINDYIGEDTPKQIKNMSNEAIKTISEISERNEKSYEKNENSKEDNTKISLKINKIKYFNLHNQKQKINYIDYRINNNSNLRLNIKSSSLLSSINNNEDLINKKNKKYINHKFNILK